MTTESYDYNATYGPLPVHDQGQEGDCWFFAHALAQVAAAKMHGVELGWVDPNVPRYAWMGAQRGFEAQWPATQGIHAFKADDNQPYLSPATPGFQDAAKNWLLKAGFAALAVAQPASLNSAPWHSPTLPVIRPVQGEEHAVGGHDLLAVGYTPDGIIVQNSWGPYWGCKGRAILSWDWLRAYCVDGWECAAYDGYPLLGMTKEPQPLGGHMDGWKPLLARRTATGPVWMFLGGVRTWIPKQQVLPPQGLDINDAVVIEDGVNSIWDFVKPFGPMPGGVDK